MSAVIPVRKLRHLGTALAFQWLPKTAVHAYQLVALKRMLAFCEKRIPFYRERFHAAGVRAHDLRTLADLRHFPATTRQEVVDAYPDGILSREPRPDDVVFRTSGTSGLFMQIAYSAAANDRLDAIYAPRAIRRLATVRGNASPTSGMTRARPSVPTSAWV